MVAQQLHTCQAAAAADAYVLSYPHANMALIWLSNAGRSDAINILTRAFKWAPDEWAELGCVCAVCKLCVFRIVLLPIGNSWTWQLQLSMAASRCRSVRCSVFARSVFEVRCSVCVVCVRACLYIHLWEHMSTFQEHMYSVCTHSNTNTQPCN